MEISAAALRAEAEGLYANVAQLEKQLRAKTITFDEGKRLWDSVYQPMALRLAESLLSYVPSDAPNIHVIRQSGNWRRIQSDLVICLNARLSEETAPAHLDTVARQLCSLTGYLPAETGA